MATKGTGFQDPEENKQPKEDNRLNSETVRRIQAKLKEAQVKVAECATELAEILDQEPHDEKEGPSHVIKSKPNLLLNDHATSSETEHVESKSTTTNGYQKPSLNPLEIEIQILKNKNKALGQENESLSELVATLQTIQRDKEKKTAQLLKEREDQNHLLTLLQSALIAVEDLQLGLIKKNERMEGRIVALESDSEELREAKAAVPSDLPLFFGSKEADTDFNLGKADNEHDGSLLSKISLMEKMIWEMKATNQHFRLKITKLEEEIVAEKLEKTALLNEGINVSAELSALKKKCDLLELQLKEAYTKISQSGKTREISEQGNNSELSDGGTQSLSSVLPDCFDEQPSSEDKCVVSALIEASEIKIGSEIRPETSSEDIGIENYSSNEIFSEMVESSEIDFLPGTPGMKNQGLGTDFSIEDISESQDDSNSTVCLSLSADTVIASDEDSPVYESGVQLTKVSVVLSPIPEQTLQALRQKWLPTEKSKSSSCPEAIKTEQNSLDSTEVSVKKNMKTSTLSDEAETTPLEYLEQLETKLEKICSWMKKLDERDPAAIQQRVINDADDVDIEDKQKGTIPKIYYERSGNRRHTHEEFQEFLKTITLDSDSETSDEETNSSEKSRSVFDDPFNKALREKNGVSEMSVSSDEDNSEDDLSDNDASQETDSGNDVEDSDSKDDKDLPSLEPASLTNKKSHKEVNESGKQCLEDFRKELRMELQDSDKSNPSSPAVTCDVTDESTPICIDRGSYWDTKEYSRLPEKHPCHVLSEKSDSETDCKRNGPFPKTVKKSRRKDVAIISEPSTSSTNYSSSDDYEIAHSPPPGQPLKKKPKLDNHNKVVVEAPMIVRKEPQHPLAYSELIEAPSPVVADELISSETSPAFIKVEPSDSDSDSDGYAVATATSQQTSICVPFFANLSSKKKKPGRVNIKPIVEREMTNEEKEEALRREMAEAESQKLEIVNKNVVSLKLSVDPPIEVDFEIACHLKDHQREGVQFMWSSCFLSVEKAREPGDGCLLSHCMGLGKTLQVLAFLHTLLTHEVLGVKHCLVLCPLTISPNWKEEIAKWLSNVRKPVETFNFSMLGSDEVKLQNALMQFKQKGGIAVVHYDGFLTYINNRANNGKKERNPELLTLAREVLLNPHILVLDEGHVIKNAETKLHNVIKTIPTKRRIILTGTPMQNNLWEFYHEISIIKPNFLGTKKSFANAFANPIANGQHGDSSEADKQFAKRREYILNEKTKGFVQRRDIKILKCEIPPKYEYAIFVNISKLQRELYVTYLEHRNEEVRKGAKIQLLPDFVITQNICSHPMLLYEKFTHRRRQKRVRENKKVPYLLSLNSDLKDKEGQEIDEEELEAALLINEMSWFDELIPNENKERIRKDVAQGAKLLVLREIMMATFNLNDKLLIFSQYKTSLDIIEEFLEQDQLGVGNLKRGETYFRIDGETPMAQRTRLCNQFNTSPRAKLFLITTKAGGMGINLHAANRVVMFNVSMNPANDEQSIFRIYRMGQRKACYVYRLIARGGMEETTYNRSLLKLGIAARVVDEQQMARNVNEFDTNNMYRCDWNSKPVGTTIDSADEIGDSVLKQLLTNCEVVAFCLEHQVLLQDNQDEHLNDVEKDRARKEVEEEERKQKESPFFQNGENIKEGQGRKRKYTQTNRKQKQTPCPPEPATVSQVTGNRNLLAETLETFAPNDNDFSLISDIADFASSTTQETVDPNTRRNPFTDQSLIDHLQTPSDVIYC